MEDAIQQGEVVFSRRPAPDGLAGAGVGAGVTLRPSSVVSPQASFYVKMEDVVIYDDDGNLGTTGDQVLANGSIEFEPTVDFRLRIRDGDRRHVVHGRCQETADLEFEVKLAAIADRRKSRSATRSTCRRSS